MCQCNFDRAAAKNHPPLPPPRPLEPNQFQQNRLIRNRPSRPICAVCHNLDPSVCHMGLSTATKEDLRAAAIGGCRSCSMIFKGVTKFCDSLSLERGTVYNKLNFRRVEILLPENLPALLNLYFSLPGGGFSTLLLDLFSTAGTLFVLRR